MDFEKLGAFYLGTERSPDAGEPVMYDSRDLTTHAVCVGMTGSGKTGLCIALIEEALIDGVPVIAIDPKGDLGNLALTFPNLAPADFAPWTDKPEETAQKWRAGLGEHVGRIARLREAGEVSIYTPGSDAGLPLSVLRSFRAPASELDNETWRDRVEASVSGLLALVGIEADPLRSREHVLLSQLLDSAWREGRDVELAPLIQSVVKPPFTQVGAFDLQSFFPATDRRAFALQLNTLLASPSFAAWAQGEPLDIPSLLYPVDIDYKALSNAGTWFLGRLQTERDKRA